MPPRRLPWISNFNSVEIGVSGLRADHLGRLAKDYSVGVAVPAPCLIYSGEDDILPDLVGRDTLAVFCEAYQARATLF